MVAKWSNRIFHCLFFISFAIITISSIGAICGASFLNLVTAGGFLVLGLLVIYFLYKKFGNISGKRANIIFAVMVAVMLVIQYIVANSLMAEPVTDWNVIDKVALSYAENGNMDHMYENLPKNPHYMAKYTNNNGIAAVLSIYYRIIYLILGRVPALAPICLNIVCITFSVVICYLIAKKIFGNFGALIVGGMCFFFLPYYTYTPYYYTDSISMPFTVLSLYLFMNAYDCKKLVSKICLFFAMGVSVSIGYALKGSVIIVLVGALVYLVLKGGIKKILLGAGVILISFVIATSGINMIVSSFNMTTEEELYEYKYPLTHWVMMGLTGEGRFTQSESDFTRNAGNYDEKQAANIEVIKERLSDFGVGGLANHLLKKATITWDDGTYWIDYHIYKNVNDRNIFHEFVLSDGKYFDVFYAVSSGIQIVILLMFCITSFWSIIKPKINYMTLIRGVIFGVMLFFLVWETRSRYLYNFTPLFILVAAEGMLNITKGFIDRNKRYNRLKR